MASVSNSVTQNLDATRESKKSPHPKLTVPTMIIKPNFYWARGKKVSSKDDINLNKFAAAAHTRGIFMERLEPETLFWIISGRYTTYLCILFIYVFWWRIYAPMNQKNLLGIIL